MFAHDRDIVGFLMLGESFDAFSLQESAHILSEYLLKWSYVAHVVCDLVIDVPQVKTATPFLITDVDVSDPDRTK